MPRVLLTRAPARGWPRRGPQYKEVHIAGLPADSAGRHRAGIFCTCDGDHRHVLNAAGGIVCSIAECLCGVRDNSDLRQSPRIDYFRWDEDGHRIAKTFVEVEFEVGLRHDGAKEWDFKCRLP